MQTRLILAKAKQKSSLMMDVPATDLKAYEILQQKSWAPICFAKRDDGFGLKEVPLLEATVLSAYAALCLAYPHVEDRGKIIWAMREHCDGQTLAEWERAEGRTQEQVLELLRKVEG